MQRGMTERIIFNVCAECEGPYTSPYNAGRCLICGSKIGEMRDITEDMLERDYLYMKKIEEILWSDFREVIRCMNKEWVIFTKKRMVWFTNSLRWLKDWVGLWTIRQEHTMANICMKDWDPVPREDAYKLLRIGFNGLRYTHRARYQKKKWYEPDYQ